LARGVHNRGTKGPMVKEMLKRIAIGLTLGWLVIVVDGCSGDDDSETPYCADLAGGVICKPAGVAELQFAAVRSDACADSKVSPRDCPDPTSDTTAKLSQPEDGKLCMKGTVVDPNGWAWLIMSVGTFNQDGTAATSVLDAKKLGATELRFTLEDPPADGLTLFAATVHNYECGSAGPPGCLGEGFGLMSGPRSNQRRLLMEAGVQQAPFKDFSRSDPYDPFNIDALHAFIFEIPPGDYDFCVSDFHFVDADGHDVGP
jgi:hypothetical protein